MNDDDYRPATPEQELAVYEALHLVELPPIRVSREVYAALQQEAEVRGTIIQAIVRERLA